MDDNGPDDASNLPSPDPLRGGLGEFCDDDPIPDTDLYEYAYRIGAAGAFAAPSFWQLVASHPPDEVVVTFVEDFAADYAALFVEKNRRRRDPDPPGGASGA